MNNRRRIKGNARTKIYRKSKFDTDFIINKKGFYKFGQGTYNAMLKPISPRRDVATLVFEKRDRHRRQPAVASPVDSKTRKTFLYAGLNTGSSSDGSYRGLSGLCIVYELAKIDTYRGYYSRKPLASIVS